mmetsp:Transcript_5717/g.16049  ORF Transcript_5717/g.16049 Transcript_5717/m.16049 type:complete len:746 (-) Transcript_5717:184-2421(-)
MMRIGRSSSAGLVACVVGLFVAMAPVLSQQIGAQVVATGLINPGSFIQSNSTAWDIPTTPSDPLRIFNITVTGKVCSVGAFASSSSAECSQTMEGSDQFEAGLSLHCQAGDDFDSVVSSEYVGGTQTVVVGSKGGLFTVDTNSTLVCVVEASGYNEGPVAYELEVAVQGATPSVPAQQAAMGQVYDMCCDGDSCTGWTLEDGTRRRVARLRSRALLQDSPSPGAADAPSPAAVVPAPEPVAADAPSPAAVVPAPGPEAVVPAPGPEAVVPAAVTGTKFDFCQFSGSLCSSEGYLTTLDLSGMGLTCQIEDLAAVLRGVPTLQRVSLSKNPNLTGSLGAALDVFAQMKNSTNTTLDLSLYPWTDILVSETGVGGDLVAGATGLPPLCQPGLSSLLQLAFEDTDVTGSLNDCMFGESSQLQLLLGSRSAIVSLPSSFGDSPSMRSLQLANTRLSGPIEKLPAFLGEFQVSNNTLNGALPAPDAYLAMYDASNNSFSSMGDGFVGQPRLRLVDLERNQLTELPAAWRAGEEPASNAEGTPPLQVLKVSENALADEEFPLGLRSYANLTLLAMSNTSLSGELPGLSSEDFPGLTHLWVDRNNITGTVPDSWGNITLFSPDIADDRFGNFSYNQMSGELPEFARKPEYDFEGNNFVNEPPPAPEPPKAPEPPAPESDPDDGTNGSSVAFAVFVTLVSLIILGIGGYYVYKWYKGRKEQQGQFSRYIDNSSSVVQMVSNQSYNPYNPSLNL